MRSKGNAVRATLAGALLLALSGCDENTTRPPVVVVTPEPIPRVVLFQTAFSEFEYGLWYSIPFPLAQRGALDLTVDWTFPDTWMYVYLTSVNCSYAQLDGRTCPFLVASEAKEPKPRVLVTDTLEPGTYYIVLHNLPPDRKAGIGSENIESVSLQLGLTVTAGSLPPTGPVRLGRPQVISPPRL